MQLDSSDTEGTNDKNALLLSKSNSMKDTQWMTPTKKFKNCKKAYQETSKDTTIQSPCSPTVVAAATILADKLKVVLQNQPTTFTTVTTATSKPKLVPEVFSTAVTPNEFAPSPKTVITNPKPSPTMHVAAYQATSILQLQQQVKSRKKELENAS